MNQKIDSREGAFGSWITPDGEQIDIYGMLFGQGRLVIGPPDAMGWDRGWCYHDAQAAVLAAVLFDGHGDPPGPWFRSLHDGRRREPDSFNKEEAS